MSVVDHLSIQSVKTEGDHTTSLLIDSENNGANAELDTICDQTKFLHLNRNRIIEESKSTHYPSAITYVFIVEKELNNKENKELHFILRAAIYPMTLR